jgi:hypothetical protein
MARKWRRERFNILFYPSISDENELQNVDKDNWSEKLSSVVNSNICRLKILVTAEDDKIRKVDISYRKRK